MPAVKESRANEWALKVGSLATRGVEGKRSPPVLDRVLDKVERCFPFLALLIETAISPPTPSLSSGSIYHPARAKKSSASMLTLAV